MRARYLGLLALNLVCWTAPAAGQTRFTWPDTTVDVSRYTLVEDCLAEVLRVAEGHQRRARRTAWADTLPADSQEVRAPLPSAVVETARRCGARMVPDSVPFEVFRSTLRLWLLAGRDADAAKLVERRLAAVAAKDELDRLRVTDTVVDYYLQARPARLDVAANLVARLPRPSRAETAELRIALAQRVIGAALQVGDTAQMRVMGDSALAAFEALPELVRRKLLDKHGPAVAGAIYLAAHAQIGAKVFLDSLRHSTAAFVRWKRALWALATGQRPEAMDFPIGQRAPAVQADYWFGRGEDDRVVPRPGRVSLIVFYENGCAGVYQARTQCLPALAVLRRLAARFPQLDITTVVHTQGWFRYVPPPTVTQEVELIRQQFAADRMPGALAVSAQPVWRLPAPDGRVLPHGEVANVANYEFGKSWAVGLFTAFLVDVDGTIVDSQPLGRDNESNIADMIAVLMDRQRTRS